MEEVKNFIKVWILAITSLCYCFYISARVPKGPPRLLTLLPIIYLFSILPLSLSTVHLGGITAFCLAWLANFKLLLLSFGQGPLSPPPPKLSHFISMASLPIKAKHYPPSQTPQTFNQSIQSPQKAWPRNYGRILLAVKVVLLFHLYEYRQHLPKNVVLFLYSLHIYLELEVALALFAALARLLLGFELEPHFNEPYLATSLQDFWGRRWNLMVTRILHPAVYKPICRMSTCILGPKWAPMPAVLGAFIVSGLMHELIYYYFTRTYPTWEVTWFFTLHGACVAIEVMVKKVVKTDRWRLHPAVSMLLTVGFVVETGFWLFFAQIVRNGIDEMLVQESLIILNFVKERLGI